MACLLPAAGWLPAQVVGEKDDFTTNAADRAACESQLNRIYGAIEQYRRTNDGQLPAKLSDLTPDFIHDPNVLICPYVRKRGGLRTWKKAFKILSPDNYTSYSYEFPPVPMSFNEWRGLPKMTWQKYKLRQVEVVGSVVPIVRCHDHRPFLSMSFDGPIYGSEDVNWEFNFMKVEDMLSVAQCFAMPAPVPPNASDFPPRDPRADTRELDLTGYYNATLTNGWQGYAGNDLAALPPGLHVFDGIRFDVRGVIQSLGTEIPIPFPRQVTGIPARQKCRRIHFLHAASFYYGAGTNGLYVMRFADDRVERFPLMYGRHIADWWYQPDKPDNPTEAQVAWRGENEAAKAFDRSVRLLHAVWENPFPETEIASISFGATNSRYPAGPFVVAITLE